MVVILYDFFLDGPTLIFENHGSGCEGTLRYKNTVPAEIPGDVTHAKLVDHGAGRKGLFYF